MKLKVLQLDLQWPKEVTVLDLRSWVVSQLIAYGEPLRWAITSVQPPLRTDSFRQLRVEAVVISPS